MPLSTEQTKQLFLWIFFFIKCSYYFYIFLYFVCCVYVHIRACVCVRVFICGALQSVPNGTQGFTSSKMNPSTVFRYHSSIWGDYDWFTFCIHVISYNFCCQCLHILQTLFTRIIYTRTLYENHTSTTGCTV